MTVDNGKITGLATESITGDTDATNKKYVDDKVTTAIGELDIPEYSAGNGIDITGETISAKAKENGNIVVDGDGISLAADVKGLTSVATGTLTASGAVTAGSFSTTGSITGGSVTVDGVTVDNGKITGLATESIQNAEDAVNKEYVDNLAFNSGKTYTAGNGIAISEAGEISAKAKENGNIVVDGDGISLAKEVTGLTSVTATGAITAGSFSGTSASIGGIGISSGKITGLTTASITENTDAANKEYVDKAVADIDVPEYKAGNGIAITGDTISAKAKQDGNIVVDENGISLATNVSGLTSVATGTLTATGAITGGSFAVGDKTYISDAGLNANSQKITNVLKGEADTDAVNVGQLNEALKGVEGTAYEAGNKGITVDNENDTISAKADEKNVTVGENGIALKDDISVVSVTTSGDVTIGGALNVTGATTLTGALTANGAATFTQGASMGDQKITNVKAGEADTDAVNKSQLDAVQSQIKNYAAGDGISISGEDNKISVEYGNGLCVDNGSLTVKADPNGNVEVTSAGIDLKDSITLTGKVTAAQGLYVDNDTYFSNDGLYLSPYAKWTMTDGLVLSPYTSLTDTSLKIGGFTYISADGLNANNKVISNVLDGKDTNDAVNFGQLSALQKDFTDLSDLAVTYDAANKATITLDGTGGTKITNVAAGDISKADSTDAVNGGQLYATNQIVGDGKWNTGSNYLTGDVEDLTDAANALDSAIGNNRYTGDNVLNANTDGKTYTSVTAAISALDSNIGNLTMTSAQAYYSQGTKVNVTTALDKFSSLFGPMNFSEAGAHYINNDANVSSALMIFDSNLWRIDENFDAMLKNVGFRKEGDEFKTTIDWSDSSYGEGTTIVTAIKDLDDRVLTLEGKNPAGQSLSAFSKMSTANVSALSALSNMDTETAETLASMSSEQVETLAAKAPAAAPAAPAPGDPTATSTRPGPDGESETGDTGDAYEVKQDLHVMGDTTLDGALTVDGAGTFNDGLTVNTKTEGGTALTVKGGASINGTLNMNGNKITGVADGEISETSTDAVNGSQLWGVQQDIENNASAIASLGGQVSRLDNRIDRVGAGAAALAALHPLDYDPEVKWDFAAGYGNYRGANAVSVGAFYRPNEDVMFSVGGSMGGGENMVNAGVSFKLGSGSGLTTSRTAMARELAAMKDTVAAQNAQIEAQAKQIEELTALVEKLAAEKAGAPEEKKA